MVVRAFVLALPLAFFFACNLVTSAEEPDSRDQPKQCSTEFTHVVASDTPYYTTGPQQGRPADGTFKAGTKIALIRDAGSYSLVKSEDGTQGYIVSTAVVAAAPKAGEQRDIPTDKQTVLGLYLTAAEAHEMWKTDPDNVKIIDVRTPEEYVFVGHPAMAWNVPLKYLQYRWDAEKKGKAKMKTNPDFLDQVKKIAKPTDTILVTCRSGQRSGPAVNLLAKAGFEKAYSVTDGFEGDKVKDPGNVFHGKRMKNGWKNSGLPWTYDLDPKLMQFETP
jgi:rhodanese-related sulfurtransferase